MKYEFLCNYADDSFRREALYTLLATSFGLNLHPFWESGLWDEKYIPYTIFDGEKAVANICALKMQLLINGEKADAIQLGAVCTLPDYRNQGLARCLMEAVLNDFKAYPFIYLSANEMVTEFYPRFGFKHFSEIIYFTNISAQSISKNAVKIDPFSELVKNKLKKRIYSEKFDVIEHLSIFFFYALFVFRDCFYYIEELDCVIAGKKEGNVFNLYAVLTEKVLPYEQLEPYIAFNGIKKVVFHFTPDILTGTFEKQLHPDDYLFVIGDFPENLDKSFTSPIMFQT